MWPTLGWAGAEPIRAYGVFVLAAYLVGVLWIYSRLPELEGEPGEFWALCHALLLGVLLGGKLGFWLVEPELRTWRTGWVFWGGLLGGILAGLLFQQAYNRLYRPRRYLPVADYFGVGMPLGHWIGRLGCLAEGCCHGRPTGLPWGVRFTDPSSSVEPALLGVPLHPVQLYEAAGELAIALVLMLVVLPGVRRGRWGRGTAFFGYVAAYSALRLLTEAFRGDERGTLLADWLSPSQWVSLGGLAVGAAALRLVNRPGRPRGLYL